MCQVRAVVSRDIGTETNPRFSHLYVFGAIRASRGSSVILYIGRQNRFNPNITNRGMTFDIYGAVIRIEILVASRDVSAPTFMFYFYYI